MAFNKYDETGEIIRRRSVLDCQAAIANGEEIRVEQSHKDEVNINNIIRKHGIDMIAKTASVTQLQYWDGDPNNDFTEAMNKIAQGTQTFESLPSDIRKQFHNDPTEYMDYVFNPENRDDLIERGWMNPPEPEQQPVEVVITNPETPPAE